MFKLVAFSSSFVCYFSSLLFLPEIFVFSCFSFHGFFPTTAFFTSLVTFGSWTVVVYNRPDEPTISKQNQDLPMLSPDEMDTN